MRDLLATFAFVGFAAAAAVATPIIPNNAPLINTVSAFAVDEDWTGGGAGPRAVSEQYDNWRAAAQGGASNLTSVFVAGTNEIADDLTFGGPPLGVGLLSTCGINIANANGPTGSTLTGGQLAVRFYRLDDGTFINGFNANLPALALAPGGSSRLSFPDGALESFNMFLPASGVYMSLQVNTLTGTGGFTTANAGYQTRGPINTGSSTDNMINVTTNSNFNFAGNPLANGGLFVKTNDVPEPASFGLLLVGALAFFRRR